MKSILKYISCCLLLMVPPVSWNFLLTDKLPPAFQPGIFLNDIPRLLTYGENILRTSLFVLTALMPLSIHTKIQRIGLALYLIGLVLYFASWLPLIYQPESRWSVNAIGFLAPAYTPLLWLTGIELIGYRFYFRVIYRRWFFLVLSSLFIFFHCVHTYLIYDRMVGFALY